MKSCMLCKNFYLSCAEPDWSDVTPGNAFSMCCGKSMWNFDSFEITALELHEFLSKAETCNHFVHHKQVKDHGPT
jgi:hypothetical protein